MLRGASTMVVSTLEKSGSEDIRANLLCSPPYTVEKISQRSL